MCTIVILRGKCPEYPLIIAANRDEFYARAAQPPQVLLRHDDGSPYAIGGRDEAQGGSWMGATREGFFVGLSNQRSFTATKRNLRSRGEVVIEALRQGSIAKVRGYLEALDPANYNPFNLVYGHCQAVEVAYLRPQKSEAEFATVPTGVHVLPNDRLNSPRFPKVSRALDQLGPPSTASWADLSEILPRILADHALPSKEALEPLPAGAPFDAEIYLQLQALCIHTPHYGTRSATLMAFEPHRTAHYLFADGPPCQVPFVDAAALLSAS